MFNHLVAVAQCVKPKQADFVLLTFKKNYYRWNFVVTLPNCVKFIAPFKPQR
jgi:hypothetical protein